MASSFDRWEKDPFFSAAEEVQESADRLESTYRTWIHAKKNASGMWDFEELRRDLQTALGTTKWQLEEFERAVRSSHSNNSNDDARDRHHEFVVVIEDQISRIQDSLQESAISEGKPPVPWVHLDEGESNELALFLSGPATSGGSSYVKVQGRNNEFPKNTVKELAPDFSKNSSLSTESHGHRRTASASAYIGAWEIAISDDAHPPNLPNGQPPVPPRKIPSLSGFLSTMESASNWPKNGVRKWKAVDRHEGADTALLPSLQLTKGINACYEKSKSCIDSCDDYYDKQFHGWYGAIQRQLQRSQYQMQYSRPVQVGLWIVLFLCLIVLIARAT
ncbi:uncharacterized protein LOC120010704 isoform X1 [Tripterygium wilfordii]|uniref:uncharacterized protein LOC120010704 isoform X1 n=1 Tax=Tripterygium wilfordii TaxID=458696 RepID=UPI0018F80E85|nr:uncharacterized protein LOC120010704 isoform X1 [Tripterygium wilfordii]